MADMDAEMAFLEAQKQEYDPAADFSLAPGQGNQDDEEEEEEEYDPDSAFSNAQEETRSPSAQAVPMAESATNTPQPTAESTLKAPPAEMSAVPTPQKQPRTKGGFVDESEDDEDEVLVAKPKAGSALLNAAGVSESPQRSVTLSPNNTHAPQAMSSISAQDQGVPAVQSPSVVAPDTVSLASATVPNGDAPVPDATKTGTSDNMKAAPAQTPAFATPASVSLPKPRLPQDTVGRLEDRVAEDPRGDIEAWLGLIDEHRKRHKVDEARAAFERFFQVFPSAAEIWVQYVNMETELENFHQVEQIFGRSIQNTPSLLLYSSYIEYVRRRYPLEEGDNRKIIVQAYEFVLPHVGIDINAGKLWTDYIEILKSGPGILGGNGWQDMQKMDILRKAYQRAIAVPTNATLEIWREYDRFEMNLHPNKTQGRKHLQERSASYMTARSAVTVAENITRSVNRTTLPKLPPVPGFDGADEYMKQVQAWKNWVEWEKTDPLEIKEDDRDTYNKRVLYIYKNALAALRFWPEMWFNAAEWSFQNNLTDEGNTFLKSGMDANPESCLIAFKRSHHLELRTDFEDGDAGLIEKGKLVREPLDTVLNTLYDLITKVKKREERSIAMAKEHFAAQQAAEEAARAGSQKGPDVEDDDDEENSAAARRQKEKQAIFDAQVQGISTAANGEILTLKKTLTYAWIALMRAMRRVQGKGGAKGSSVPGFRGVFGEARKKGKLLSDAYVASALIEHHCYQDAAAGKIFERGMRLFPDDESFALEYIKHLIKLNDATNARAVFETIINRLTQKSENIQRTKPLFLFFHDYESQFGDLAQINKLEQRMATLFPEDPLLERFTSRFKSTTFDPTVVRPVISPRTQMRPAMPMNAVKTVEEPQQAAPQPPVPEQHRLQSPAPFNSPRLGHLMPATNSPKRPLEDADNDQPRKMIRGESPLKGAAGRRLDAARRNNAVGGGNTPVTGPSPLPKGVNFLLGIIPPAHTYQATRFQPEAMVNLLRSITVPLPAGPSSASAMPAAGPPAAHIGAQLQNIQARYGVGLGYPQ
ncbi:Suf-domain-containing protein [Bimuria novae-zelandiae CBS 107.79]|uniref:mRNA 3'-end-processing protein RNA14 n=1 Tax=Bimuria novae-zelandiae CBS 107.79 TaxID=1447943 RepID=A0A6A5VK15_9PLEO|nr:Suf-domain-containing protein [Bimuria novae-zelandiae CBS 107.79]